MSRALSHSNKAKTQQVSTSGDLLKQSESSQQSEAELSAAGSDHFLSPQAGVDLTQVPARPGLRTKPRVQCCAKDGGNCSCPKCSEARDDNEKEQAPGPEAAIAVMPAPAVAEPSVVGAEALGTATENVGAASENAGVGAATAGMTTETVGAASETVGAASETAGVGSATAGAATETVGAASEAAGVGSATAGMTKETVGAANETAGVGSATAGMTKETVGAANETAGVKSGNAESVSDTSVAEAVGAKSGNVATSPAGAVSGKTEPASKASEPASVKQEEKSKAAVPAVSSKSGLIAEDSAGDLKDGQMKKTVFLRLLKQEIRNAIEPVLAKAGQTTEGCPYLHYWLNHYQGENAAHVESAVRKYAPDSSNAKSAEEYISVVVQKAVGAAEIWAATGELSGVPEGVPLTLPGDASPGQGEKGADKRNKDRRSRTMKLIAQKGVLQAKARNGGLRNTDDPQAVQEDLGAGEPLAGDVRSRMESAFGMNFSHVRTHTDSTASGLSSGMNARAFTVGQHVAFAQGEYRPGTVAGDALIAHELAHTVQQGGSNASPSAMREGDGNYSALEQDADHTAAGVLGRLWRGGKKELKGMAQRTMPTLRSGLRLQRCGDAKPAKTAAPKEKTMPKGTISGTLSGLDMDATATYSDCSACTDGLEAMQVAWATGGPKVGVHETTLPPSKDTYWSFVDGGSSSPGGAVYGGDKHPYYIGRADLPASYKYNGGQGSAGSVSDCTVNVKDKPTAAMAYSDVYFETAFVCLNFQNSGEDKLLEAFKWGFYDNGAKNRVGPGAADSSALEMHSSGPSDKFKETLKADYPSYTFT